jgi:hypothetical protein
MKQKLEKALEWVGYVFIAGLSVIVLSMGFTILWQASKAIWKTLIK